MSKRKSLLVATMLVGLVVLIMSRLFQGSSSMTPTAALAVNGPGSPNPASGDPANLPTAPPGSGSSASRFSLLRIVRAPFPTNLPLLPADQNIRNVFSVPVEALNRINAASPSLEPINGELAPAAEHVEASPSDFKSTHQLTAVMDSASAALVLVNDQWLEIGEAIDGCVLKQIESERALFACPEGETELIVNVE